MENYDEMSKDELLERISRLQGENLNLKSKVPTEGLPRDDKRSDHERKSAIDKIRNREIKNGTRLDFKKWSESQRPSNQRTKLAEASKSVDLSGIEGRLEALEKQNEALERQNTELNEKLEKKNKAPATT